MMCTITNDLIGMTNSKMGDKQTFKLSLCAGDVIHQARVWL